MSKPRRIVVLLSLVLTLGLCLAPAASAEDFAGSNGGPETAWSTAANWLNITAPVSSAGIGELREAATDARHVSDATLRIVVRALPRSLSAKIASIGGSRASAPEGTGSLMVRLAGLPRGQRAAAMLRGPNGLRRTVPARGLMIAKARPGLYSLTLSPVKIARANGSIKRGAIATALKKTVSVHVSAGKHALLQGTYTSIVNPGLKTLTGGVVSITGATEDPSGVVLRGHVALSKGNVLSMAPSAMLPRGLLSTVTGVTYSSTTTSVTLTAASIYAVAPNFQFDVPLEERQASQASAADFSVGCGQQDPAPGLSPYRRIKNVSFSGGWSTADVFGVHVTDGVKADVHFTVEAGLDVTAGAGISCSLSLAFYADGLAGFVPVTAGIEGELEGSAALGGVLESGGSIEVVAGGHTVGLPPTIVFIPDVSFSNPRFTMNTKAFAQASAGIGLIVKAGVGVGGIGSLTMNVGSSLDFNAQPGSCRWTANFAQFSAEGEIADWHLSTPLTPALFTQSLGSNFCVGNTGSPGSGSGGSGGSGGGSGGGTGGGGGATTPPSTSVPSDGSPPVITDEQGNNPPQVTDTLKVLTGAWSEHPTGYTYQWEVCKSAGSCSTIPGATSSSYTLSAGEIGDTIRVTVTAYNAFGTSQPVISEETAVVGAPQSGVSVYPNQDAWNWSINGQFYLEELSETEHFLVDTKTHETTPIFTHNEAYLIDGAGGLTRVANNGTLLFFQEESVGELGLYVKQRGAEPKLIMKETDTDYQLADEYQLSEDGSTVIYTTITEPDPSEPEPRELIKTLHSYNVATERTTIVTTWSTKGASGSLLPLWLDYVGPSGESAIFGYCRLGSNNQDNAEECSNASAWGSWEAEGVLSFNDLSAPQLLPPPAPYADNHETGDPATYVSAVAPNGTIILTQWDRAGTTPAGAGAPGPEFVYQPGSGVTEFPKVGGKACQYVDTYGSGANEGQYTDTTNGISSNGRYVMCSVESEAHNDSTYMMDLQTDRATLINGPDYGAAFPEWVSENGTEAIFYDEYVGGHGKYELLKWVSPVDPLP